MRRLDKHQNKNGEENGHGERWVLGIRYWVLGIGYLEKGKGLDRLHPERHYWDIRILRYWDNKILGFPIAMGRDFTIDYSLLTILPLNSTPHNLSAVSFQIYILINETTPQPIHPRLSTLDS